MKKTITLPNGQTETVEGTADEIAAYERAKREEVDESKTSKKKILLTEEQVEQVRELIRQDVLGRLLTEITKVPQRVDFTPPPMIPWINPQPWAPPLPYIGDPVPFPGGTTTSDKIVVNPTWEQMPRTKIDAGVTVLLGGLCGTFVHNASPQA